MSSPKCNTCHDRTYLDCPDCQGFGTVPHRCSCGDLHATTCATCHGGRYLHCTECAPVAMRGVFFGRKVFA